MHGKDPYFKTRGFQNGEIGYHKFATCFLYAGEYLKLNKFSAGIPSLSLTNFIILIQEERFGQVMDF